MIIAENSPYFKIEGCVSVSVEGTPNDFVVKCDLCKKDEKHSRPQSIFLESMFLGGYFITRRLKSEEAWLNLQKEFWRYVENILPFISNTAKSSS